MISVLFKDCTRTLDSDIQLARVRYALERLEFHSFFPHLTVRGIQNVLRAPRTSVASADTRRDTVARLFDAQQQDPHDLWTLLLVQACEAQLVERRLALPRSGGTHLDSLVVDTFVAVLDNLPPSIEREDMQAYALRASKVALQDALRSWSAPKRTTTVHERTTRSAARAKRPQLTLITTPALAKPEAP